VNTSKSDGITGTSIWLSIRNDLINQVVNFSGCKSISRAIAQTPQCFTSKVTDKRVWEDNEQLAESVRGMHEQRGGRLTCNRSCITFSIAGPFKLPGAERVSLTATFRADNTAYAMFTIIAVFLLISRCRLLADRKDVICSNMLS
jgi:hypothetical protein